MRKPEFIVHVARRENTLNAVESIASLTSASSQTTVSFFGAQLLSWTPTAGRPVIWQTSKEDRDPNSPVRGGIPICLPWFSAPALSKASLGQTQTKHGIARTQTWKIEPSTDPATAVFSLTHTATEEFPHSFCARYSIESGDTLVLGLEVTNTDDHAFFFEQALHTYFAVSDVSTVTLGGLEGAHCEDFLTETSFIERNTVSFEGPTDRLYHCDARVTLDDPEWQRQILITSNASGRVVWTPWSTNAASLKDMYEEEWSQFICVEACDARSGAKHISPGTTSRLDLEISVRPIGDYPPS